MCDVCSDVLELLESCDDISSVDEIAPMPKKNVFLFSTYIQTWAQRQCMCCFRDVRNYKRFNILVHSLLLTVLAVLRNFLEQQKKDSPDKNGSFSSEVIIKKDDEEVINIWNVVEKEKLLHFVSKVFELSFPLYVAYKHSVHSKIEEVSQDEATKLNNFCDVNDPEIPVYLLRNVCFFCEKEGVQLMTACFRNAKPETLPINLAHALVSVMSNLKLWMNINSIVKFLVLFRKNVIRYMCSFSDKDFRNVGSRNMSEFMWTIVKDPLDAHLSFDNDGLDLAFKYFTSTTLTMRLAGIAQINTHINMYNELCNNDNFLEADSIGNDLSSWLIQNKIIEHIFGPNLHVEIIKQSHIILNFLAMESKITNDHIDCIWCAAQLKHCSRQVHDLLPSLIKNMDTQPVLYLYKLLVKLDPQSHTEQTLFLASALIKFIWSNGNSPHHPQRNASHVVSLNDKSCDSAVFPAILSSDIEVTKHDVSSSENSISIEASEDEQNSQPNQNNSEMDGSQVSDRHQSSCGDDDDEDEDDDDDEDEDASEDTDGQSEQSTSQEERIIVDVESNQSDEDKRQEFNCVKDDKKHEGNECLQQAVESELKSSRNPSLASSNEANSEDDKKALESKLDRTRRRRKRMPKHKPRLKVRIVEVTDDSLSIKENSPNEITTSEHEASKLSRRLRGEMDDVSPQEMPKSPANIEVSIYDCRPYLAHISNSRHLNLDSADDAGSCNSSKLSNKSEKNMADFDGEDDDSGCDDELVQLAAQAHLGSHQMQHLANMTNSVYHLHHSKLSHQRTSHREYSHHFDIESVCKQGHTLLWDLLQDDKITSLMQGIAIEAERVLCNLVCWANDRNIRMKFVEGCLHNLANNKSVVISLRLLPKLFSSFQHCRGRLDMHSITLWAEKEHEMMKHFFNNLVTYTSRHRETNKSSCTLYSHQIETQVRLQFLTCVFSTVGSPDNFRLSLEQVGKLWTCLATDPDCSDELFSWLLNQAKNKDQHAMGLETFKHIFLEKMPLLEPENFSMTTLNLFQQLSELSRLAELSHDNQLPDAEICGMNQLWGIALKADNTEVSMAAIQFLNNYYISVDRGTLIKEEECIERCMESLSSALKNISEAEEFNLIIIQRGLLLLRTHLEAFRKRYAYHLRHWQLKGEGVFSHRLDKPSNPIRVVCQPAGLTDKVTIVLGSTDYIADLRAEVTVWWDQLQEQNRMICSESEDGLSSSVLTPILGSMLTDGPIRIISQGQELTTDNDERTLEETGFKDLQLVFVSVGAPRPHRKRDGLEPASVLPPPLKQKVPMNLLLQPHNFEQLFNLMQQLSSLKTVNKHGDLVPHTKAQVLSRRVWETLMMLPTSPTVLEGFLTLSKIKNSEEVSCFNTTLQKLLSPESPQKLLYSLQIVESLCKNSYSFRSNMSSANAPNTNHSPSISWTDQFIENGGLRHLYDIFLSGALQVRDGYDWDEWNQDCLEFLLKMIYQLGVESSQVDLCQDEVMLENYDVPKKKSKRNKKGNHDKLIIPVFNQKMLEMMDVESGMKALMSIIHEASTPCDPNQYKTGFWSRAQVVHNTFSLLISWYFSNELVRSALFNTPDLTDCLKKLILDHPEPTVRREACTGLHKLCLGTTTDGRNGRSCIAPLLSRLLTLMPVAQVMRPPSLETEEEKEPYGPSCKDFFWLVWHLVDNLDDDFKDSMQDQKSLLNLDNLARYVAQDILKREYHEMRHYTVPDDGLIGLLTLCTVLIKRNVPFKFSKEGQEFILDVFDCIFALPCPEKRYLPKCKSQASRSWAYDLVVELVRGCFDNYQVLHNKLLLQHSAKSHAPYPWDYWPHEDGRSDCGYVGLTNLGATCYMASCMQHLYMLPQARGTILSAKCNIESRYETTLTELQKMFAYLLESERKAYNPKSFCKVYTMDHQPLNTGEQKDMAEFFTDLISKLEDMTPQLKDLVKNLFCGVTTNNVVSLDCPHISRTIEEFYTVRCQVIDVRNLYESLNETTVKDTLEGDNMYTCSQCGKKVRAEKRACFKKLPKILCFNTMRYTFDMRTMSKEKVNTHFSFPLRLDMSGYMERHLMPGTHSGDGDCDSSYEYDLIGVTVHTGTADGGHYYSFIRERSNTSGKDKWYSFNDAEVKYFDPARIATECFGGEMTVRSETYDSVTDKFMDFSLEKTNSAYMLFYERVPADQASSSKDIESQAENVYHNVELHPKVDLSNELAEWIWQDNMQFLQDKSIFEHTYFNFMWQICGVIPQTLTAHPEVTLMSAKLSTSFVLETLIHAKEKPTMVQWIELLTKQFNASQAACEWFMEHMAEDDWWPVQILIKCPNQMVRQMFQRLCIHVINKLKPLRSGVFLESYNSDDSSDVDLSQIEHYSCVTRFAKKLLTLIEQGAKQHLKHLTEYFAFLFEFAKMGDEECQFLLSINAISIMINFYLGQKSSDYAEAVSDEDEEEDDVISVAEDKYKPASLEKMITLIAMLVEKSRGEDRQLHLSSSDLNAIAPGKGFPFLFQQIKDNINIRQTCNLVFSLCRWNERMAMHIVNMTFGAITKHNESSQPFFKLLSMLTEFVGGPPGMPPFTNLILQRIWEIADFCPQPALEWLAVQVPRNKIAHSWVLRNMETWVEHFLIANNIQRVRNSAAFLLVSLVPSPHFRQAFRTARSVLSPHKEIPMNPDSLIILHQIYDLLLRLLKRAKLYVDPTSHGTSKLMSYFALLTYCLISRTEKLMFGQYFLDLWQLFQPKLSEPPIAVHHNKQALLIFWYHVCIDCPENVKLLVQNAHVTKNIAFNYILADHDQQDVIIFNRFMLPAYYGLLRLCCQQSRPFTRQLANHQNIQWAFKHITPYTTQYGAAVDELFKLMRMFVMRFPDNSDQELKEIMSFKQTTLTLYIDVLDPRSCWTTLISVFQILIETNEDRLYVILNNGLSLMFESFHMLHMMYHEATACHITGELVELLSLILDILKCARMYRENPEVRQWLIQWKDLSDYIRKLLTLLNSYTPNDVRKMCVDVLKELVLLYPVDALQTIVPMLSQSHSAFHANNCRVTVGPYYPHRGQKIVNIKSSIRPQRPLLQMLLHPSQLEASKGIDEEYDQAMREFFFPYHQFVDMLCRVAINYDSMTEVLVNLSVMVGCEAVPLHLALFPKLWLDIYNSEQVDRNYLRMLCNSNYISEYMEMVLMDERLSLTNPVIYHFMSTFLPKVSDKVLSNQTSAVVDNLVCGIISKCKESDLTLVVYRIISDLRVLSLLFAVQPPSDLDKDLETQLLGLSQRISLLCRLECDNKMSSTEKDNKNKEKDLNSTSQPSTSKEGGGGENSPAAKDAAQSKESAKPERATSSAAISDVQSNTSCASHPLWAEVLSKTVNEFLTCIGKS